MKLLQNYDTKISDVAKQYLLPARQPVAVQNNTQHTFQELLLRQLQLSLGLNLENDWRSDSLATYSMPTLADFMQQLFFSTSVTPYTTNTLIPSYEQVITNYTNPIANNTFTVPRSVTNANKRVTTAEINAIVKEAATRYGVDEKLIHAIIKMESNYNPNAVSRAGAVGLMQLMPATARSVGVTDPFDIRQNIFGGTAYFSKMLKSHQGDIKLALAAYNAGPGNVKKYGGIPPFKETQNYIRKVLNYYQTV